MKIKNWPEKERPRERLINYGPESLSNAQLLAIILRTGSGKKGVLDLSIGLLERFETLRDIDSASISDLLSIDGLGMAKIAQIKAAFELGKRLMAESFENMPVFSSAQAVFSYLAPKIKNLKKEIFLCLLLDSKNRLMKEVRVSEGTLNRSLIHPREAFREAVREAAQSVIFVHNHPSGDPSPSKDDITVTERLRNAGEIIGIDVLDHIIIGDGRFVSLKDIFMIK